MAGKREKPEEIVSKLRQVESSENRRSTDIRTDHFERTSVQLPAYLRYFKDHRKNWDMTVLRNRSMMAVI